MTPKLWGMKASERIRDALARVGELRQIAGASPDLARALHEVKTWQSKRFAHTYQDLLQSEEYAGCARFFLEELYSERDYSHRDAQFARVAGAVELTFPEHVVEIAVDLAELHATTERLDLAMAKCWANADCIDPSDRYLNAWKSVGESSTRNWQLQTVLHIGRELSTLTKKRGLRLLLKMMRRPAEMAGLGDLQSFLETGFDEFGRLAKTNHMADQFLTLVNDRETKWLNSLYEQTNGAHKAKNAQSIDWAFRALGA